MFKRTVTMMLAAGTLVLGGCASNGGAEQAAADNSDFGGKSIYQQCKVDVAALSAMTFGVGLQDTQLIVKDLFRLPQQAADQRAFAVIDAAAGDKAQ